MRSTLFSSQFQGFQYHPLGHRVGFGQGVRAQAADLPLHRGPDRGQEGDRLPPRVRPPRRAQVRPQQDRGQRRHRAQQDERGAARAALLPEGNAARRAAAARGKEEPFLGVVRARIGTDMKPIELKLRQPLVIITHQSGQSAHYSGSAALASEN